MSNLSPLCRSTGAIMTCALAVSLLVGCESILDQLASRHCEINSAIRASDSRGSLLFAQSFIYVPPDWSAEDVGRYTQMVEPLISRRLEVANEIFARNGAHIAIFSESPQVIPNETLYILNLVSVWGPEPEDDAELQRIGGTDPHLISLHWSRYLNFERNSVAGGESAPGWAYVLFYGTEYGSRSSVVAHELGHYFGLGHYEDRPGNLMNPEDYGDRLDRDQIEIVWRNLNGSRAELSALTCDSAPP